MSFFGKLKSKLFKSSSKLEEGLDAIVQEGGSEDAPEPSAPEPAAPPAPHTYARRVRCLHRPHHRDKLPQERQMTNP